MKKFILNKLNLFLMSISNIVHFIQKANLSIIDNLLESSISDNPIYLASFNQTTTTLMP